MAVGQTRGSRIEDLRRQLDRYRRDLGTVPRAARAINEAERKVARNVNRIRHIEVQMAELDEELRVRRQEVEGRMKLLEAALEEATRSLGDRAREHWSPTPILGFRAWTIKNNELVGVKTPWTKPSMAATCLGGGGQFGVPHSDGRCGRLGCGIYAAKSMHHIIRSRQLGPRSEYVLGLVALEGKVVEHELGYRAEQATIVAAAAGVNVMQITASDDTTIARLCRNPHWLVESRGVRFDNHPQAIENATDYLNHELTGRSQWT